MRTTGTPEPGSLISFCFSCIFCNSEEVGLFSILVSTTASDSSGKEEFTIFNGLKGSKPPPPTVPSPIKSTVAHEELVELSASGVHVSISSSTKLAIVIGKFPLNGFHLYIGFLWFYSLFSFHTSTKVISSFCIFFFKVKMNRQHSVGDRIGVHTEVK